MLCCHCLLDSVGCDKQLDFMLAFISYYFHEMCVMIFPWEFPSSYSFTLHCYSNGFMHNLNITYDSALKGNCIEVCHYYMYSLSLYRCIKLWNDTPIIPGSRFAIAWNSLLITTILASCWLYSFQV